MNEQPAALGLFERLNRWLQESITVKLFSIGFMILLLLIPAAWIQSLITERQDRAEEVVNEVASKWSGSQTIGGPILVIPYLVKKKIDHGKDGIEIVEYTEKYFALPEKLNIDGEIIPKKRHRGIFDVVVYQSDLTINASFNTPDMSSLGISPDHILWKDAHMIFAVSDLRGISENPEFKVGESAKDTEPSSALGVSIRQSGNGFRSYDNDSDNAEYSSNGILARLGWQSADDFKGNTVVHLKLKGSSKLLFTPTGKTTSVKLKGEWESPSFEGKFLPEDPQITEKNFTANWNVLHYNRPFAQTWTEDNLKFAGSEFGVKLLIPVDQYQKSMRTSKYGHLIIILTFMALFLVEVTRKIRIHPIQYLLIAAALIIYYTLLLSISEHLGFDTAYIIASLATVSIISFYSVSFLKSRGLVMLFTSLLLTFYVFIFVIVLQQDYALLIGSIGLFLILSGLMYFARRVDWYNRTSA